MDKRFPRTVGEYNTIPAATCLFTDKQKWGMLDIWILAIKKNYEK